MYRKVLMGTFDLKTKSLFLTYSQCDKTKEDLYNGLAKKLDIQYAIIAKEQHKESGDHLHAYVELKRQRRFRNCKELDLDGFHPNITSARNRDASKQYCKKDGDWAEFGDSNFGRNGERDLHVRDGESFFDYFCRQNSEGTYL